MLVIIIFKTTNAGGKLRVITNLLPTPKHVDLREMRRLVKKGAGEVEKRLVATDHFHWPYSIYKSQLNGVGLQQQCAHDVATAAARYGTRRTQPSRRPPTSPLHAHCQNKYWATL